jgi:hypothetical protein
MRRANCHGVFPGSSGIGSCPEHSGCRDGICAERRYADLAAEFGSQRFDERFAYTAALPVYYRYFQ